MQRRTTGRPTGRRAARARGAVKNCGRRVASSSSSSVAGRHHGERGGGSPSAADGKFPRFGLLLFAVNGSRCFRRRSRNVYGTSHGRRRMRLRMATRVFTCPFVLYQVLLRLRMCTDCELHSRSALMDFMGSTARDRVNKQRRDLLSDRKNERALFEWLGAIPIGAYGK